MMLPIVLLLIVFVVSLVVGTINYFNQYLMITIITQ
jgi:hypothetical protein